MISLTVAFFLAQSQVIEVVAHPRWNMVILDHNILSCISLQVNCYRVKPLRRKEYFYRIVKIKTCFVGKYTHDCRIFCGVKYLYLFLFFAELGLTDNFLFLLILCIKKLISNVNNVNNYLHLFLVLDVL